MTLEKYAPQLSNCFLLNDSRDICTATFELFSFKWLLRNMHRNFQTASFLMTLKIYALQLSDYFLLNDSWDIHTPQLSHCFLVNDSWDICTPQLSYCFLVNDSWEICTATFKLLPCKWLLKDMLRNFQTVSFLVTLERYAPQLSNSFLLNDSWNI